MKVLNLKSAAPKPEPIPLKDFTIAIYSSPKELPAHLFTDFQKYLIQAAGIGSETGDVDRHFGRVHMLMANGMHGEAAQEMINMQYAMYMAINKISVRHLAFAVLVYSFNDRVITDHSESALLDLIREMGEAGLTDNLVTSTLSEVKKKSIEI